MSEPLNGFTVSVNESNAPADTVLPQVPGYEILGELGRGGMGVVFKAKQVGLERLVALKMILAGEYAGASERQRFRTEALAVARLQHPNVVQVFAVGEHDGRPFLCLELVQGGSLADWLGKGPLPARQAAELVERLARGVQAAHEAGIIHRDLKPANVLLARDRHTPDGTDRTDGTDETHPSHRSHPTHSVVPKITDFGLAKRMDAQTAATQTGAVLGTPAYMAPEQAGGVTAEVGPATDVWALGAVLYECLTGRPPFQGPTPTDTILHVLSDEPVPPRKLNPAVPRDLETIALKCLRKRPARRYTSAAELADDLHRFLHGEPIRARPLSLAERLWRRRRRFLAAGLVLLVLASFGVGTFALLGWQRERRDRAFDEAMTQGRKQAEGGKAREAIAFFNEALRIHPGSSHALADRGTTHGLLGDHDLALADFAEAIRTDPNYFLTYRRRAWVLMKRQRWSDAATDLDTAVRLAPGDILVRQMFSTLHAAQGRWAEAVREYAASRPSQLNRLFTEAAAALAGGDEAGYRQTRDRILALAGATGDGADAATAARVSALEEKTDLDPSRVRGLIDGAEKFHANNPVFLRVQAMVWVRTGEEKKAVGQLQAVLNSGRDNTPAITHLLLSIAHERLGERKEADRAFESAQQEPVPVQGVHETLEYQVLLREARMLRRQR